MSSCCGPCQIARIWISVGPLRLFKRLDAPPWSASTLMRSCTVSPPLVASRRPATHLAGFQKMTRDRTGRRRLGSRDRLAAVFCCSRRSGYSRLSPQSDCPIQRRQRQEVSDMVLSVSTNGTCAITAAGFDPLE